MFAQTNAAPLWQEGRGWYQKTLSSFDPNATLPHASSDYRQCIATIRAQMHGLESEVSAGLIKIANARNAARGANSASGREYWRCVAIDEANHLESRLRIRRVSGGPVPPTVTEIKNALDAHRVIAATKIELIEARTKTESALSIGDLGAFERLWSAEFYPSSRLAELERMLGR